MPAKTAGFTRCNGPALLAATLLASAALGACASGPSPQEAAVLADAQQKTILPATRTERDAADRLDLLAQATFWGKEYDKNPNDPEAVFKFARILRAIGSAQRAVDISGPALAMKPDHIELALVYAQASLDIGKPDAAAMALAAAEGAGQTDWRMLSIIGVTMDQMGEHRSAQIYYQRAAALSPSNPKILSNLGLSYALSGDPARAETTLREAAALDGADTRVRQNLALVLGVQGKFDEAEQAAGSDTPRALVEANNSYFRAMLTPPRHYDRLRGTSD